jgi:hypothetical protein
MKLFKSLNLSFLNLVALILSVGHLFGGIISIVSIVLISFLAFFYFIIAKKLDIFTVFLLLVPNVLFELLSIYPNEKNLLLANFNNVIFLGSFSISSKFFLALAVPIRLLLCKNKTNKAKSLLTLYFIILSISIISLFYAYLIGISNSSGLTIGLRSVLSLGVLFLPNIFNENFYSSLNKIFLVSIILISFNFVNGHWMFVVYGFIPFIFIYIRPRILIFLILFLSLNLFYNLENTITILSLAFFSFLIIIFNKFNLKLFFSKPSFYLLISLPLISTIIVLLLKSDGIYDFETLSGFARFKLLGDRKPIWDSSWNFIQSSNFFYSLPGSVLEVYFDFRNEIVDWPEGSHNIILELSRNISIFAALFFFITITINFIRVHKRITSKINLIILFCFLNVFIFYGLTGNSLVYDGVGFLFWLMFVSFKFQVFKDSECNQY